MSGNQTGNDIFDGIVIENIDLEKGRRNFNAQVYGDVLRAWCKHIPANLEKLRSLAGGVSDAEIRREYVITVHGLKGSSHGICAENIGNDAEALEAAGRRGDIAFIEANNEPFIEKALLLLSRLRDFFAAHTEAAGEKPMASSMDSALLDELLNACKQFKSSTMEEILKKLDAFEYESGGDLIPWLREQMDNLEYDAIQERLSKELGK